MNTTIESIKRAFASVPKPGDLRSIAPHECPECDELANDLVPFTFDELPAERLLAHFGDLPLLGPHGLHHYLPAYLSYALDHPESSVMEFTVLHLTPSNKNRNESPEYFDSRFGLFNSAQRAAIAAFFSDVRNLQLYDAHEGELDRAAELWPNAA